MVLYTPAFANRYISISQLWENETRFFVFNYYPKVEVYDMILYKNQWYRITRVDTADDYKGDLFIYVQNAVGGWIPSDDEIEDYTPGKWDEWTHRVLGE